MKAILMSIKPKWCEMIFSGVKTVEERKTAPKLELPFKVYVYETKTGFIEAVRDTCPMYAFLCGKVIGEFVCDKVEENIPDYHPVYEEFFYSGFECGDDCLSHKEIQKYGKGDTLHGLHITAPKLYDTPKALSEFKKGCNDMYDPQFGNYCGYCPHPCFLTRPPQSWCYVEEIEE